MPKRLALALLKSPEIECGEERNLGIDTHFGLRGHRILSGRLYIYDFPSLCSIGMAQLWVACKSGIRIVSRIMRLAGNLAATFRIGAWPRGSSERPMETIQKSRAAAISHPSLGIRPRHQAPGIRPPVSGAAHGYPDLSTEMKGRPSAARQNSALNFNDFDDFMG